MAATTASELTFHGLQFHFPPSFFYQKTMFWHTMCRKISLLQFVETCASPLTKWAMEPWVRLHDNVPANLLPRWQKFSQSHATPPRCTDVPDWVKTSAVQPTVWNSDSFNFKCHGGQFSWHPTGATLAEGWSGTLSRNPTQAPRRHHSGDRIPFNSVYIRTIVCEL